MVIYNDRVFDQLEQHINHDLVVTPYGTDDTLNNVAIECRDCCLVLHDIEPERNEPNH